MLAELETDASYDCTDPVIRLAFCERMFEVYDFAVASLCCVVNQLTSHTGLP